MTEWETAKDEFRKWCSEVGGDHSESEWSHRNIIFGPKEICRVGDTKVGLSGDQDEIAPSSIEVTQNGDLSYQFEESVSEVRTKHSNLYTRDTDNNEQFAIRT